MALPHLPLFPLLVVDPASLCRKNIFALAILRTATLDIQHIIFVNQAQTGDFQTTKGLQEILDREGNSDDIVAFLQDRLLPVDDIEAQRIADEMIDGRRPATGYLTISNALQWRLQYQRIVALTEDIPGISKIVSYNKPK